MSLERYAVNFEADGFLSKHSVFVWVRCCHTHTHAKMLEWSNKSEQIKMNFATFEISAWLTSYGIIAFVILKGCLLKFWINPAEPQYQARRGHMPRGTTFCLCLVYRMVSKILQVKMMCNSLSILVPCWMIYYHLNPITHLFELSIKKIVLHEVAHLSQLEKSHLNILLQQEPVIVCTGHKR